MAGDDYKLISEQVGPVSAIALLIGTALGMSIFVVPTQMAAEAGPSILLAILVSIVPMTFGVLLLLQLGGAIPVAGGIYVYGSRLVGPYWGFLAVVIPVLAVWSYLLFAALGFAQYIPVVLDAMSLSVEVPELAAVWLILGLFLVLNYVGVQMAAKIQIALVSILIAGMLVFIGGSALSGQFETSNFTPMFPETLFSDGVRPFILAVVMLYIPFQGFSMIIEIGEELENPVTNIPRVLAVGMGLVTVLSVGIIVALIGAVDWRATVDWSTGEAVEGGLAAVGPAFLPTWAVIFVGFAALIAAATTINTLITSYSRTVMRAARDDVVPGFFAKIHDEYGTPHRAVAFFGLPPMLIAPFTGIADEFTTVAFLDWLVVVVVTGIFIAFMIGGIALWNLPKVFPQRYEYSIYKLPMPVLKAAAVGNFVSSLIFTVLVATSAPSALVFVLAYLVLMSGVYVYRIRAYDRKGIDLKERMALLDKHEAIGSTDGGSDD